MTSGVYIHKKGYKLTEEHRKKISESRKGKYHNEDSKKKMSLAKKGIKFSDEHKRKLSLIGKKRKHSEETKRRMSLSHKGKIITDETKKKLSESHKGKIPWSKGKKLSEQSRKKISLAKIGIKFSDEHKRKLSDSHKRIKISDETKRKISLGNKGKKRKLFSDETIKKMKIARSKRILPIKDTRIEIKIRNFLDELKVEYFQHKYINITHSYQCDFFVPSINTVIECDGQYWHKYPTGREIDHIRTKELLEQGFRVLRLWEIEIKEMDVDKFKQQLYEVTVK